MKRLFFIAIAMVMVGCNEKKSDICFDINATVSNYVHITRSNDAMMGNVISTSVEGGELSMGLSLFGESDCSVLSIYNNDQYASRYRQLQSKFSDNNPNASTYRYYKNSKVDNGWRVESGDCIYYCLSDKISKIDITSDRAWGEGYPAGASLNELFTIQFTTLYDYVQRGFTGAPASQYKQVLSDVNPDYYALLSLGTIDRHLDVENIFLSSTTLPSDYKEHNIKVSITLDTEEVIEYTAPLSSTL